jgi:hypothetical protein
VDILPARGQHGAHQVLKFSKFMKPFSEISENGLDIPVSHPVIHILREMNNTGHIRPVINIDHRYSYLHQKKSFSKHNPILKNNVRSI